MSEPAHHRRYRIAWEAYSDPDTPDTCYSDLRKEMDDAQNHFSYEEFLMFKNTLLGFNDYWKAWGAAIMKGIQ